MRLKLGMLMIGLVAVVAAIGVGGVAAAQPHESNGRGVEDLKVQGTIKSVTQTMHTLVLYYLVMPYMWRGTLLDRLAQGPLTEAETGAILQQLADALGTAHELGIIHGDIKPSNILLGEQSTIYLADFGVATAQGGEPILRTDMLLGTPSYMAPELIDKPATVASDIYATGVLLYQLLTGHLPFQGTNPLDICWKHAHLPPPPPTLRNPALSPEIEQVVLRALEKKPHYRFQTVQEMAQAYRGALTTSVTKPQEVLPPSLPRDFEKAVTLVAAARNLTHPAIMASSPNGASAKYCAIIEGMSVADFPGGLRDAFLSTHSPVNGGRVWPAAKNVHLAQAMCWTCEARPDHFALEPGLPAD